MKYCLLVIVFFLAAYIIPLGNRPLMTPDEFRYAEIPREMLESGNMAVPHLLNMRYFEKPAPAYWPTAVNLKIFGETRFAIRFSAALSALLTALLIFFAVLRLYHDSKMAALSAVLFLFSGLPYAIGTFAVLDSQFCFFVTGTSVCAFLALQESAVLNWRKILLLLLCGVCAGAAFLTKGFLAFAIPVLALMPYLLWERKWREFIVIPWLPLLAAAAVVLPWALRIHQADGDFWRYFLVVEHWQRFSAGACAQHSEPWWFYFPWFVTGTLPAGILLPVMIHGIRSSGTGKFFSHPLNRFSLCAVILPFILLSCSHGKLATYILPCYPFLAILGSAAMAGYLRSGGNHRVYNWVLTLWGALLIEAGTAFMVITWLPDILSFFPQTMVSGIRIQERLDYVFGDRLAMAAMTGICACICGWAMLLSHKASWWSRFYIFTIGIALILMLAGWSVPEKINWRKLPQSSLEELEQAAGFDRKNDIIVTFSTLMQAVAWVYHRPDTSVIFSPGEIEYGSGRADDEGTKSAFIEDSDWRRLLVSSPRSGIVYIGDKKRTGWVLDRVPAGVDFAGPFEKNGLNAVYFTAR